MTPPRAGTTPTAHELQVLSAFCQAEGTHAAAARLGLSHHTVRNTLANIRLRLGVQTTAAAVYLLRERLP